MYMRNIEWHMTYIFINFLLLIKNTYSRQSRDGPGRKLGQNIKSSSEMNHLFVYMPGYDYW